MRTLRLLFPTLLLAFSACQASAPDSEPPASPIVKATPAPAPPAPTVKEPPAPPPLLPAKDSLDVPLIAPTPAPGAQPPPEPPKSGYWTWRDASGIMHMTDNEASVPTAMRDKAVFTERKVTSEAERGYAPQDDSEALLAEARQKRQQREQVCENFKTRSRAAVTVLHSAEKEAERVETGPPQCGSAPVPGFAADWDPQCEEHWQQRKDSAQETVRRAKDALEQLRDEARRADVSASCVESGD